MDEPVADRVCVGRLGDVVVEALRRDLAADDRGPGAVAIVEHLEEVAAFGVGDRGHRKVIDHQDVGARELREHPCVGSIGARERELREESRSTTIDRAMSLSTRLLRECTRDVGLADSGRAGDQHVLVLDHPATRRELTDLRLVELALGWVVDVLDTRTREP